MTPTQRKQMLSDVISDRVRMAAYKAFFIYWMTGENETGTIFKQLNK